MFHGLYWSVDSKTLFDDKPKAEKFIWLKYTKIADLNSNLLVSWELVTVGYRRRLLKSSHFGLKYGIISLTRYGISLVKSLGRMGSRYEIHPHCTVKESAGYFPSIKTHPKSITGSISGSTKLWPVIAKNKNKTNKNNNKTPKTQKIHAQCLKS